MATLDKVYMQMAELMAAQSYCLRTRVGAVVKTSTGALYPGYNGTISKHYSNVCELPGDVTAPWVSHAEENALDKMLKEGVSAEGATIYVTHSCCHVCARRIINSGIRRVVYRDEYRDLTGLEMLRHCGVIVEKWSEINQEEE